MLDYARKPICDHKDQPVYARGLCAHCYNAWRWKNLTSSHKFSGDPERRHPELILGFAVNGNCKLCRDAMPHMKRECQLHPDICNTCEQEYCECQVQERLTSLDGLEDTFRMSDEEQVSVLLARKKILKMFGGKATAMNVIVNKHPEETTYITITRAGWKEDDPWLENARRELEEMNEEGR